MTGDWQLNPIHSGAFLRLQRILPKLRGFRVLVMQHNNPAYRDGIIAALDKQKGGVRILDVREYGDYLALEQALLAKTEARATHIIGLESFSAEEQARAFKGLNYHREQIAKGCQHTLLFWLPEPLVQAMLKKAADFWAWREQVFDFLLPVEVQERWEDHFTKNTSLDKDKKQRRIEIIKAYLAEQESTESSLTAGDMLHELGNLYETLGEYHLAQATLTDALSTFSQLDERHAYARVLMDKAYLTYRQGGPTEALKTLRHVVLPWFIQLSDTPHKVLTLGKIADILQARGQLDEALRIRQTEQLPVYEQLGDVREKAVTMGKIADILQARGQLDEALRIRQTEQLPVYEQLGDVREKAVTMGKIADILQARGQLDEALSALKDEVLPAFEQLGDVQSKAVTMGKIADILQARGQLDEALRILEKEALPILEQLGNMREIAAARNNIAVQLWQIDSEKNAPKVQELLCLALNDARRLKIPEAEQIESILKQYGLSCPESTAKD